MPKDPSETPQGQESNELTVEVDGEEKKFTANDVKNLLAQQASATQKTQRAKPFLDWADRYNMEADEAVYQAEGALALTSRLIDEGIIDGNGNILVKKQETPSHEDDLGGEEPPTTPRQKIESAETKAILKKMTLMEDALKQTQGELRKVREDNTMMLRHRIAEKIMAENPTLDREDVSHLLRAFQANPRAKLDELTKKLVTEKADYVASLRQDFAKEFGIDIEKAEKAKQLKEQSPDGGAAGLALGGRRVSFTGKDGTVSPKEATRAYLDSQNE